MHTTIRFVGGPWHNRFCDLELCPEVVLRRPAVVPASLSYAGCFANAREDRYYLAVYETGCGTRYMQYVHQSLISNGKAPDYYERLPKWQIDKRQLDSRLRKAAGCLLKKRKR